MSDTTEELQQRIEAIVERYRPEIEQLKAAGQAMQEDVVDPNFGEAVINVDFDIEWRDKELIFDVPQFSMREKRISLHLPTVFSDRQRIVFDTPSVRMVDRIIGYKPEFRGFPPKIKMTPIIISIPEPFMERQEIIFDLPSVRMEQKDIVLNLPEVRLEQVRWVVRLPEITLRNVRAATEALKDKGEALKTRGEELSARMRSEIDATVAAFQGPLLDAALSAKQGAVAAFDGAIGAVNTAITDLQRRGVDPIKVPAVSGEVNLRKVLAGVVEQRDRAVAELDAAVAPVQAVADEQPQLAAVA